MHKKMPATTWLAWVHVFNYFICLLDRGASEASNVFFALSFGSLFFFDLMKYTMPSTSKTKNNRNKIISTSPSLDNYIVVLSIKRCIE